MWAMKYIILLNFVYFETSADNHPPTAITNKILAIWKNATVPFYVNTEHFDHEQTIQILTALSMFAFKTCIKFVPVMAPPKTEEVLVFQNPEGLRRCIVKPSGHSVFGPHILDLGYGCLKSPYIDMLIMKTLGFPFEHNRFDRDTYMIVLEENVEVGYLDLFRRENSFPSELMKLQYDVNSVMHFDQREYSRNGHRTIIFKNPNITQSRDGLTATDLKKIEIVYGPECTARDRQEKIELCQSYPGVARKKRELGNVLSTFRSKENNERDVVKKNLIEYRNKREVNEKDLESKSLRVNSDITVPPTTEIPIFKDLNVEEEVQKIVENAQKITTAALRNAKDKYCNGTELTKEQTSSKVDDLPKSDVLRIVEAVNDYVKSTLDVALKNLTEFCGENDMKLYLRSRWCNNNWGSDARCPLSYKSTKSGLPRYSTQHRPAVYMSTKNFGANHKIRHYGRSGNDTVVLDVETRKKREAGKEAKKTNVEEFVGKEIKGKKDTEGNTMIGGNDKMVEAKNQEEKDLKSPGSKPERRSNKQRKRRKPKVSSSSSDQESTENKQRPMEIINEWKEENKRTTKRRKKEYSIELIKEEDIKTKKYKHEDPLYTPKVVHLSKANREFYKERMWPELKVWYMVQKDNKYDINAMRKRIEEVNEILKEKTCVELVEITPRQANKYEDYIVIDNSPDYVTGRVGGKQHFGSIELFRGDQHRQHTAMMVMAMLGFYFEVSRHDRDQHLRVHMRHIRPDKLHHFEKIRSDATLDLPYDYASATHPAWQFWRKIGHTGIAVVATLKENDTDGSIMKSLGQNEELLSELDLVKINSVYGIKCFNERN